MAKFIVRGTVTNNGNVGASVYVGGTVIHPDGTAYALNTIEMTIPAGGSKSFELQTSNVPLTAGTYQIKVRVIDKNTRKELASDSKTVKFEYKISVKITKVEVR